MRNKVSILVPIYGVEMYIKRCVRSLFEQTYSNIEYVFVNDCTKDKSVELLLAVLEDFPNRKKQVKIIHHKNNRGLSAARNTAVENMTGDYLWHVDSDDWLEVDAVKKLVAEMERTVSDVIIMGYNDVKTNDIICNVVKYKDKESYISGILQHAIPGSVWNKFFSAKFYRNSGIRSVEGLNYGEDYAIIPRLLHKAKTIHIFNEPLYNYNLINQSSYTHNINKTSIANIRLAYQLNVDYFVVTNDKELYGDTILILPFRSMLSLIKNAHKERYNDIVTSFPECLENTNVALSLIDKVILLLLKLGLYSLLSVIIKVYKRVY